MTDETIETPAEQAGATIEQQAGANDEPTTGGNKEAAKYRTRLREAEAERDRLAQRLEALQRSTVETIAGKHLEKPNALWAAGTELANLLDKDGNIDAEKVEAAALTAREDLGLTRAGLLIVPDQGKTPEPKEVAESWQGAFTAR